MACCNYVRATSVTVESPTSGESYWLITVPDTYEFKGCCCIGLSTTLPTGISCASVQVTNGTDTLNVLKNDGNYWRPCKLGCNSVVHCQYLSDPEHLLIKGVS